MNKRHTITRHSVTRHSITTAFALAAALLVAGCGSSSDHSSSAAATKSESPSTAASPSGGTSAGASTPAAAAMITIKNFKYTVPSNVAPGAKVTVKNEDTEAHTVTADGKGGFDVKIDPGATATLTAPSAAGSYAFHCTYHSNMHGTLKVG